MSRIGRGLLTAVPLLLIVVLLSAWMKPQTAETNEPSVQQMQEKIEALNDNAGEAYTLTQQDRVMEAKSKVDQMAVMMTRIQFTGLTSVEGIHALSEAMIQARRTFAAIHYSSSDAEHATAILRLVTDALAHPQHPMWLQYEKMMNHDLEQFSTGARSKNIPQLRQALADFNDHYRMIRLPVLINRSPSAVEKMDSLLKFMKEQADPSSFHYELITGGLHELKQTMSEMFNPEAKPTMASNGAVHPYLLALISIGTIILSMLILFAWKTRRYDSGFRTMR